MKIMDRISRLLGFRREGREAAQETPDVRPDAGEDLAVRIAAPPAQAEALREAQPPPEPEPPAWRADPEPTADPEPDPGPGPLLAEPALAEPFPADPLPDSSAPREALEDPFGFAPEEAPADFLRRSLAARAAPASGGPEPPPPPPFRAEDPEEVDWEMDEAPARISGEGILSGPTAPPSPDPGGAHDFLKTRGRGRRSVRRVVLRSGTRLSIDPALCRTWAEEILGKGWFDEDDLETLISACAGDGAFPELRAHLARILETAGIEARESLWEEPPLWEPCGLIEVEELAEALAAGLTRDVRPPGATRRFHMDRAEEARILDPAIRARQELELELLGCAPALDLILERAGQVLRGAADPAAMTLRSVLHARPDHPETARFAEAAETLEIWRAEGRVMDGRRRRTALAALDALDLSTAFHREATEVLAERGAGPEARRLEEAAARFDAATERMALAHLPYARRFSSRSVREGEDPEDVFQAAFIGLQRATRRFDPAGGRRFVVFAAIWMHQTIGRWRAEEGAEIRLPVHRGERLRLLDQAISRLDLNHDRTLTDAALAAALEWSAEEVALLRRIPRLAFSPESAGDWDEIPPQAGTGAPEAAEEENSVERTETTRIVAELLEELPERDAEVIRMRFGFGGEAEMTLEEIGQLYGLTRERIRQIEARALRHLAHPGRRKRLAASLGI
ncbi:sigma-70 family RNA polymerase sigma factor [Neomegalonema sp.]|uniref:sigma-70 family RNA polymerase sigma factor n=1 Tax=Neomegalonema sp. TaxID=2039713 RepID=UPI00262BC264|nr:sigma-70 family RNA polymerase sigma factor [Neomegalonema sp.]MDD2868653.1 sigma-70 family RNA polymerase sigma factor [Neomegalonema sp.]